MGPDHVPMITGHSPFGTATAQLDCRQRHRVWSALLSFKSAIPSVDRLLGLPGLQALAVSHGRTLTTDAVRHVLAGLRAMPDDASPDLSDATLVRQVTECAHRRVALSLRPVFNLTGTVLHTNLGRAPLPESAIDAMAAVARGASNLEYAIAAGKRGDRDDHIEERLCRLTGAEAATVVNNNAAAVLLALNALAARKEVPVSRGELIEIGGAFRLPDIMRRAGTRLVEVGTTNRTHARDYEGAIGERTALLMKVHTSNYAVEGFTAAVAESELAAIAHEHGLPLMTDLGSGTLVDLTAYGLPAEPTVGGMIAAGADLVTFSGDKLLGGPQAGLIVGRADLIAKLKKNPMKRALRCDKVTLAALEAVLILYEDPDSLPDRLPALRLLTRAEEVIRADAEVVLPVLARALDGHAEVDIVAVKSQIGSGALPVDLLPSAALRLRSTASKRRQGRALKELAAAFRGLPCPVIGRVGDNALMFDLRCLDDKAAFTAQLDRLVLP